MTKAILINGSSTAEMTVYHGWDGGRGWLKLNGISDASLEVLFRTNLVIGGDIAAASFQDIVPGLGNLTTDGLYSFEAPAGSLRFQWTSTGSPMATGQVLLISTEPQF